MLSHRPRGVAPNGPIRRPAVAAALAGVAGWAAAGCGAGQPAGPTPFRVPAVSLPPVASVSAPPATGACALLGDADARAVAGQPMRRQASSDVLCTYAPPVQPQGPGVMSLSLRHLRLGSSSAALDSLATYTAAQTSLPGASPAVPAEGVGDRAVSLVRRGQDGDELQIAAVRGADLLVVDVGYRGAPPHTDTDARTRALAEQLLDRLPTPGPGTPSASPGY